MKNINKTRAYQFLDKITQFTPQAKIQFVILGHILPDIIDFLEALEKLGSIALVIAIPYSLERNTFNFIQKKI